MANSNKSNERDSANKEMLMIEIEKMISEGGLGAEKYYDLQQVMQDQANHSNN